jgi:hypothetical protein
MNKNQLKSLLNKRIDISEILNIRTSKNDLSPNLNLFEIEYITNVLRNNEVIETLNDEINMMADNGKIYSQDIPKLILMIYNIFKNYNIDNGIDNIVTPNIVRFIIISILESNKEFFHEFELIRTIKILNSSIELLQTDINIPQKKDECCNIFNFWY